jgi:hypothetical protein
MRHQVDRGAQQVLDQLVAAHHALFSFSAQIKTEAITEKRRELSSATLSYQKPGKCRLQVTRPSGKSDLIICDGTTRVAVLSGARRKSKAESGEKALVETLTQASFFISPVFAYVTSRSSPVRSLLPGAPKVLGFGNPTTIDKVSVDQVIADIQTKEGLARLQFFLGKDDRLLRRLIIQTEFAQDNLTLSETYTEVKANPNLDKKAFLLGG